ncbi:hypothetical protein BTO06_05760 [Tenacibaculum sp. SZ-18]|uniref:hypothetical protein n=1 Tax=Tenacibaculum sp. SZ-18 TaxID=754423 RepID=UPI000C2D270C|nr:hypothetical protein [Tenacibaculum sp. SZ-18]AUC14675.1 hypothetical protein BTO06_05760 [Tenacibaculum sp. SZ-18]
MLKNIENLGKSLSKKEQKQVEGGFGNIPCRTNRDCWNAYPFLGPGDVSCRNSWTGWGGRVCIFN